MMVTLTDMQAWGTKQKRSPANMSGVKNRWPIPMQKAKPFWTLQKAKAFAFGVRLQ
jgi:hypothetical protein